MNVMHISPDLQAGQANTNVLPLQPASEDIWAKKYRLTTKDGVVIDEDVDDTYRRIARAIALVEDEKVRSHWEEKFLFALRNGAVPAGRICSNAGAEAYKAKTTTINCTVSGDIPDSMDGILTRVHEAGITLKSGAGIGYCFSVLRPRGAYVAGAGASTSGPLSFMDIFDKMCATVSSAGARRGAQMATFDACHPDIMEFIRAKREDGRLRQFNLSVLISDDFQRAEALDEMWPLVFPVLKSELDTVDLNDPEQVIWRDWPSFDPEHTRSEDGLVACRIYKKVRARNLFNAIMTSNYDYAEPGVIFIDKVNEMNNNWFCETISSTNPLQCGHA